MRWTSPRVSPRPRHAHPALRMRAGNLHPARARARARRHRSPRAGSRTSWRARAPCPVRWTKESVSNVLDSSRAVSSSPAPTRGCILASCPACSPGVTSPASSFPSISPSSADCAHAARWLAGAAGVAVVRWRPTSRRARPPTSCTRCPTSHSRIAGAGGTGDRPGGFRGRRPGRHENRGKGSGPFSPRSRAACPPPLTGVRDSCQGLVTRSTGSRYVFGWPGCCSA